MCSWVTDLWSSSISPQAVRSGQERRLKLYLAYRDNDGSMWESNSIKPHIFCRNFQDIPDPSLHCSCSTWLLSCSTWLLSIYCTWNFVLKIKNSDNGEPSKEIHLGNSYTPNNPSCSRNRCRNLPGVLVTSLNSSKSKSKVGGWCCRGQLDTAAVSCSNRMIQTSIRPGKQKADPCETQISIRKNPLQISVNTAYEWHWGDSYRLEC